MRDELFSDTRDEGRPRHQALVAPGRYRVTRRELPGRFPGFQPDVDFERLASEGRLRIEPKRCVVHALDPTCVKQPALERKGYKLPADVNQGVRPYRFLAGREPVGLRHTAR